MSRNGHVSSRVAWTIKLLVSVALLGYIATQISLGALFDALAGADPVFVALGLVLSALGMFVATVQLRVLGEQQGIRMSPMDAFTLNLSTSFYNLLLPGTLAGGVARWYRLARSHADGRPFAALAVVLANRVVELITVLVLGLLFWTADPLARSHPLAPAAFAGLLIGVLTVVLAISRLHLAAQWLLPASWRDRVLAGLEAAARFGELPGPTLGRLAGASVTRHLLMIGSLYCFGLGLHIPLSVASAGWTRTVVSLAGMLPLSVGGLGVREGSLIAVLRPYGVPAHAAAALGLLIFARELLAALAGGIVESRTFLAIREARET